MTTTEKLIELCEECIQMIPTPSSPFQEQLRILREEVQLAKGRRNIEFLEWWKKHPEFHHKGSRMWEAAKIAWGDALKLKLQRSGDDDLKLGKTFRQWWLETGFNSETVLTSGHMQAAWQAAQDALRAKGTRAAICDRPDGSITATTHPCSSFNINGWVIKDEEAK